MRKIGFLMILVSCCLTGCSWFRDSGVSLEEDDSYVPKVESSVSSVYSDEDDSGVYGLASDLDSWSWSLVNYDIQEYLRLTRDISYASHYKIYLTENPEQDYEDLLSLVMLYYNLKVCPEYLERNGLVSWETEDELANLFGFVDVQSLNRAVEDLRRNPLTMFKYFRGRVYGNQIATYDLRYFASAFSAETPYFRYPGDSEVVYSNRGVCLVRDTRHALLMSSEFSSVPVLYKGSLYYILLGGNTHCAVSGDVLFGSETVDGIPICIYCDWQSVLDAVPDEGILNQNSYVMFNNVKYAVVSERYLINASPDDLDALFDDLLYGVDWNALCAIYGKYTQASDLNVDSLFFDYFGFHLSDLEGHSSDEESEFDNTYITGGSNEEENV